MAGYSIGMEPVEESRGPARDLGLPMRPEAARLFAESVGIMARLRGPGGCPWDREQSFETIRKHTLEETYEVLDAIERKDWPHLAEELVGRYKGDRRSLGAVSLAADAAVSMQLAKRSLLQRNYELLSPREREVLAHITTGKLNKQIAAELGTTLRTIKAHRSSIIAKMQARSSAELGIMAVSVIPQKPLPAPGGNWSKVQ